MFFDLGNVGGSYRFTALVAPGRHHRSTSVGGALTPGIWLCMTRKLELSARLGVPWGARRGSAKVTRSILI